MTELQAFLNMLGCARVGYGTRNDPGGATAILVCFENVTSEDGPTSGWAFDSDGRLVNVILCDDKDHYTNRAE